MLREVGYIARLQEELFTTRGGVGSASASQVPTPFGLALAKPAAHTTQSLSLDNALVTEQIESQCLDCRKKHLQTHIKVTRCAPAA